MEPENELIAQRREKLEALRARGVEPFGRAFETSGSIAEVRQKFKEGEVLRAAGRITAHRDMGKSHFVDLRDATGRIQAYFHEKEIGAAAMEIFNLLDLGDFIGVEGTQIRSVGQGAPAATGKMARFAGCRSASSTALCRSCRERAIAGNISKTDRVGARDAPVSRRSRFCRGGNADAANRGRRRGGCAIQHAPQSSGTRFISPHRAGTLSQTSFGRRIYQSVRTKSQFSK